MLSGVGSLTSVLKVRDESSVEALLLAPDEMLSYA